MAIRKLRQGEQDTLRDHLLRLGPEDRQMRFMGSASDSLIQSYCGRIDWLRTTILGYFTDADLRGVAELVQAGNRWPKAAELALTVERPFQNRGIGTTLLQKALVVARNRFTSTVYMTCLLENKKMQRIAHNCGASLVIHEGESEGTIWPPWPSYLSLVEEAATEGQALFRAAFEVPSSRTSIVLDKIV
ncbi:GNAT family N-acetyltransferase [Bradyrhizobium sp.]|uniref:GNAT family N-acetyltransferase n=1 Tax=Bradyrhizobium sp. TaxID=376 RepID=UPI003C7403C6